MSSQLVDINSDGHMDILAGSFSGTPQIIMGHKEGYAAATDLLDKNDEEVLIAAFWNTEDDKWDETDRSESEGHCTSSYLVDWDSDGDLDILHGDYYGGRLYVQMNEGSADSPQFSGKNIAVKADGEPVVVKGGMAAPLTVDWNGDGRFDILCGGAKGGIYFYANTGTKGSPEFAKAEKLIEPLKDNDSWIPRVPVLDGHPALPGKSYHLEVCDYDADGDLDLLIGGRVSWLTGPVRMLTDEEQQKQADLEDEIATVRKKLTEMMKDKTPEERKEIVQSDEYQEVSEKFSESWAKMSEYETDPTEEGDFVWLFRRK